MFKDRKQRNRRAERDQSVNRVMAGSMNTIEHPTSWFAMPNSDIWANETDKINRTFQTLDHSIDPPKRDVMK